MWVISWFYEYVGVSIYFNGFSLFKLVMNTHLIFIRPNTTTGCTKLILVFFFSPRAQHPSAGHPSRNPHFPPSLVVAVASKCLVYIQ